MAQLANSFATFSSNRVREQLMDKIWNVSVEETPTLALVGKESISGPYVEWLTDDFASGVATNKVEQGNSITSPTALTAGNRFSNRSQISEKNGAVTATQEWADKAGKQSDYDYHVSKKMVELKKDVESSFLQNSTAIAASAGVAPQARGLLGFIYTNTVKGSGGVDPVPLSNTAPTDGTQAAFTETMLKSALQKMFDSGAPMNNLYALLPSTQRTVFDTFLAGQTRFDKAEDTTLHATLEVYIGPFGRVKAVNARHMRQRDVFIINPEYVKLGVGRPMRDKELPSGGDYRAFMVNTEWTTIVKNEKALAAIRDLT
jgi:hypothetical protein